MGQENMPLSSAHISLTAMALTTLWIGDLQSYALSAVEHVPWEREIRQVYTSCKLVRA